MKPEVLKITTPVCLFQFAWLVEPDTKFDASGIWQVECLINPDDATQVEEQLSGLLERWKAQLKTANPNKKFKVYVKNEKGKVVVVRFGDPNMSIKRDDPERRKSFRARHNCDNPGPKWKARYWSCYQWRANAPVDN